MGRGKLLPLAIAPAAPASQPSKSVGVSNYANLINLSIHHKGRNKISKTGMQISKDNEIVGLGREGSFWWGGGGGCDMQTAMLSLQAVG